MEDRIEGKWGKAVGTVEFSLRIESSSSERKGVNGIQRLEED